MNIKHLYWRWFGYPDLPPKSFKLKCKTNQYTNEDYFPRYYIMTRFYLHGKSLEQIASLFNVTRERVRQCIWKCYWDSYRN